MTVYFYGVFEFQGGMENYAKNLITGVLEKDKSIHFAIIKDRPSIAYEDYFASLGCDIITIPNQKQHPLKYYKALKNLFSKAKNSNDIVQTNVMSFRNFLLFRALKASKAKGIIVAHGAGIARTPLRFLHVLLRPFFKRIGQQVAISKEAAAFQFGKNNQAKIIPNAIDPRPFGFNAEARDRIRNNLCVSPNTLLLGQVGRVCPIKNQVFSIRLTKALLDHGVDARLLMIGAIQDARPAKLAEDLHIKEGATFLGEANPREYYSAFDVLLVPSLSEGAGLIINEGEANGVPIIVSTNVPRNNVNAINMLFVPLECGLWEKAIQSPALTRRFGERCVDNYSAFVDRYQDLFRSLG